MGIFSAIKKAFSEGTKQINKDYGKNPKFLKAVCASTALIIWADGEVEDSETKIIAGAAWAWLSGRLQ